MSAAPVSIRNDQLRAVLALLTQVKPERGGFKARCPAHADRTPSLSVSEGADGRVLVKCFAGCETSDVLRAIGLTPADLFPPKANREPPVHPRGYDVTRPTAVGSSAANGAAANGSATSAPPPRPDVTPTPNTGTPERARIVATYDYRDADGDLVFQVVRLDPKSFRQRRWVDGAWVWSLGDTAPVLYRLPEVLAAAQDGQRVYVVEGEKDADALVAEGYVATTSPMGAGKWRDAFADALRGAEVIVIPDHDDVGRAHAEQVAAACTAVGCPVRVVRLPDLPSWTLPAKGDVSDWLAAGGTLDILDARTEATPRWRAPRPDGARWRLDELWADEVIMRPPPPVVPYLAWAGRSTLLASAEKAGKSTLTGYVAAAVSRGATFLDEPCQRGDVLLIGLEEFIGDAARRLQQFRADPTRIHLVDRLPGDPRERPRALAQHVEAVRPVLVIVDSLIAFSEGAVNDAGSSAQMGPLVQTFTTLAHDLDVAIVIIHHARKQDGRYRDSSAIGGAVDLICEMFAPDEDADPPKRQMRARGRVPVRDVTFRLVTVDGPNGTKIPSGYVRDHAGAQPTTLPEKIVAHVAAHPGCSTHAVAHAIGARKQVVVDELDRLQTAGRLANTGHGQPSPGGTVWRLAMPTR